MGEIRPDRIDLDDDPELTHLLENLTDDDKKTLIAAIDAGIPEE